MPIDTTEVYHCQVYRAFVRVTSLQSHPATGTPTPRSDQLSREEGQHPAGRYASERIGESAIVTAGFANEVEAVNQ